MAEKLLTLAINTYQDTVEVVKEKVNLKNEKVSVKFTNDGPKKLAARRRLMAELYDIQEKKGDKESNSGESDHDIHVIVIGIPFGSEEDAENDETPSADNSAETNTEDENPAKDSAENPSNSTQPDETPETATPAPENSETTTPTNNSRATSFPPVPPEPEEFSY